MIEDFYNLLSQDVADSERGRDRRLSTCSRSFGPGCRVRVDSSSTYKGRYGTITEANGMPGRWFVAIDDDNFSEVSFYARELAMIITENDDLPQLVTFLNYGTTKQPQ